MNISLASTLKAFKPPAAGTQAQPGTAPKSPAAALLETGLEAQLINKDSTIPQAVKDEKLKALTPKAQQTLAMLEAEAEASTKSDLVDSTEGAQADPATEGATDADPADPTADPSSEAVSADDAAAAAPTAPPTYETTVGKGPAPSGDQAKGALVDVHA
jgi:hypothetical protein